MLKCWRIKHTQFIWREKEKVPAKLYSTKSLLSAFKIMKGLVLCKFAIDFLQLLSQQLIKPIFLEKPKLVNAGKLFRNYPDFISVVVLWENNRYTIQQQHIFLEFTQFNFGFLKIRKILLPIGVTTISHFVLGEARQTIFSMSKTFPAIYVFRKQYWCVSTVQNTKNKTMMPSDMLQCVIVRLTKKMQLLLTLLCERLNCPMALDWWTICIYMLCGDGCVFCLFSQLFVVVFHVFVAIVVHIKLKSNSLHC